MKNVIIFNNRSLRFYDFKELKNNYDLRISAVVFNESFQSLSADVKESLDNIYVLPDVISLYKSLESFPKDILNTIVQDEVKVFPNTWVVAADELNNLELSILRDKYSLSGTPYPIILNFRDKGIQKEVLKKQNFHLPKFVALHRQKLKNSIEVVYKELNFLLGSPFIVKPLDMFGTIGVEKIESYEQFFDYFAKFPNFSDFIAEEFIHGQLYHCDFIIYNDQYVFAEVSEYLQNGLAFIKGYNHGSLLLTFGNPIRSSIIEFCKKANAFLGLRSGCGHFEVFVTKEGKIVFLEAAARPAGSMVPLVFSKTFKKNYMNAALLAEIEESPGSFPCPLEYHFWVSFPKKAGVVKALKVPPLQSSHQLDWFIKEGDFLDKPSLSLVERSGMLLAHNQNYQILKNDFYSLKYFEALETQ
jgi:hypothetical protein